MDYRPARRIVGQAAWVGVPIVAGAYVVLVVAGPMRPEPTVLHHAHLSPALAVLDLAAGVGIIAVGMAVWVSGRLGVGLLATLGGMSWFGVNWAGDSEAAAIVRVIGMIAATLTLPIFVHLALLVTGRMASHSMQLVVGALYTAMATLAVAWLVWYVPRFDPRCLELCRLDALTSLGDHRVARMFSDGWQWLTFAAAMALSTWAVIAGLRTQGGAWRRTRPLIVGAATVGLAWSAWALALMQPSSVVAPTGPVLTGAFAARAAAVLALTVALGTWLVSFRRTLAALQGISNRLSPFPGGGSLRSHLADALGDPGLRLLFTIPGDGSLIDPDGQPADPPARGAHVLPIEHGSELVAVCVTSRPTSDDATTSGLGPALRLAAANERLLAAVRHELVELSASRQRVVEAADAERHRLERNLHDGAQQSMVALLHKLTLSRDEARAGMDSVNADRLAHAIQEADAAIDALRLIARGIHDPVLLESGLLAALDALSVDAPIPVEFDLPADLSCRPESISAAWRVVVDVVQQAARLGGEGMKGRITVADGTMTVALAVEGLDRPLDLLPVEDRVAADGGRLTTRWDGPSVFLLHAVLKCA